MGKAQKDLQFQFLFSLSTLFGRGGRRNVFRRRLFSLLVSFIDGSFRIACLMRTTVPSVAFGNVPPMYARHQLDICMGKEFNCRSGCRFK